MMLKIICVLVTLFVTTSFLTYAQEYEKPKAIVHIGPYKTGTSWFQALALGYFKKQLVRNNYFSVLLTNEEVVGYQNYLLAHCVQKQHQKIVNVTFCEELLHKYRKEYHHHLRKKHNIIITSEVLSSDTNVHQLLKLLDGFEVYIILVYRNYVDYFISVYNQIYKNGQETKDFPTNVKNCFHLGICYAHHNFDSSAAKLVDYFSKFIDINRIKVFDYNGMISNKIDVGVALLSYGFPGVSDSFKDYIINQTEIFKSTVYSAINTHKPLFPMDLCNIAVDLTHRKPKNPLLCMESFLDLASSLVSPPLKCTEKEDFLKIVNIALDYDKELRDKYSSNIVFGNETANLVKINEPKESNSLCSLNKEEIALNSTLVEKILLAFENCE